MNNKNKTMLRKSLIIYAKNLMFYVYQFESKVDELNDILCTKKMKTISTIEIFKKRERINNYLTDAMIYISKLYTLISI